MTEINLWPVVASRPLLGPPEDESESELSLVPEFIQLIDPESQNSLLRSIGPNDSIQSNLSEPELIGGINKPKLVLSDAQVTRLCQDHILIEGVFLGNPVRDQKVMIRIVVKITDRDPHRPSTISSQRRRTNVFESPIAEIQVDMYPAKIVYFLIDELLVTKAPPRIETS